MGNITAERFDEKEYSPKELREMLGVDNAQIQALCKYADIKLKKNNRGLTYFTNSDVEKLKDISKDDKIKHAVSIVKAPYHKPITQASISQLIETLKEIEKSMTNNITSVLDEKLDGLDDVVMELIRVKSENETMRFKINELNKENYKLKKEVNSFKKVPFGFYAKTTTETNIF